MPFPSNHRYRHVLFFSKNVICIRLDVHIGLLRTNQKHPSSLPVNQLLNQLMEQLMAKTVPKKRKKKTTM